MTPPTSPTPSGAENGKQSRPSLASSAQSVDFVLVTALSEERDALLQVLPDCRKLPPSKDDVRNYFQAELPVTFSDGTDGVYQVVLLSLLDAGRIQAATATTDAIHRWRPRYVLLVGIASGIASRGVRLGDILISDQVVDYELQELLIDQDPEVRWEVHRADARLLGACRNFMDNKWQELLLARRPGRRKPRLHLGSIASGDKIVSFGNVLKKYQNVWPKLIGVELEAGGVATSAFQAADPPGFFMVRCVSDLVYEDRASAKDKKWHSYACNVAAVYAVALLKSGPVPLAGDDRGTVYGPKGNSEPIPPVLEPPFQPASNFASRDTLDELLSGDLERIHRRVYLIRQNRTDIQAWQEHLQHMMVRGIPVARRISAAHALALLDFKVKDFDFCTVTDENGQPCFRMARNLVTNAQYSIFLQATGASLLKPEPQENLADALANHPVTRISWHEAVQYCEWMTERLRAEKYILPNQAAWLPTMVEWRQAFGQTTYPWGGQFDSQFCNTQEADIGSTTPVGIYLEGASPFGILDLAGNVREWTRDGVEFAHWVCGGSFADAQGRAVKTFNDSFQPDFRSPYIGFRLVIPQHE